MEPLGNNDIRSIMKEYGFTYTWLGKKMHLSRQAIHNWITRRALTEDADYRYRLLATYILNDELHSRMHFVKDTEHAEVAQ